MAMDDVGLRAAVAGGDLSGLPDAVLDDHERSLLVNAARGEADDDVGGFGSFAPPYVPVATNLALMHAVRYAEDGLGGSPLQPQFNTWTGRLGAQGTW